MVGGSRKEYVVFCAYLHNNLWVKLSMLRNDYSLQIKIIRLSGYTSNYYYYEILYYTIITSYCYT